MSFLGERELKSRAGNIISDYNEDSIKSNHYELTLGQSYCSTTTNSKVLQATDNQIIIEPGEFYFLESFEILKIPSDLMAFISIKSKVKFKGLINISGFHVDPNFQGKLVFSVLNVGTSPINLTTREPLFQIWFADLTSSTNYHGHHQNLAGVNGDFLNKYMISNNNAYPADLQKQINKLETKLSNILVYGAILITLISGIFFIVFKLYVDSFLPPVS